MASPDDIEKLLRLIPNPPRAPPGFPGSALTPPQQQCFELVKTRFSFNGTVDPVFANEMVILKFCRARDFEVDKVVDMMDRHFAWRSKPLFQNPTPKMGHLRVVNHVHTKKVHTSNETPNQHECEGSV